MLYFLKSFSFNSWMTVQFCVAKIMYETNFDHRYNCNSSFNCNSYFNNILKNRKRFFSWKSSYILNSELIPNSSCFRFKHIFQMFLFHSTFLMSRPTIWSMSFLYFSIYLVVALMFSFWQCFPSFEEGRIDCCQKSAKNIFCFYFIFI